MHLIGLDLAATTGFCHIDLNSQRIYLCEFKSLQKDYDDKVQDTYGLILDYLANFDKNTVTIGIEKFVYFAKSRVTQIQLGSFYGYVYHSLKAQKYDVNGVYIASARKHIRPIDVKNNKKDMQKYLGNIFNTTLTDNQTDALTVALFFMNNVEWKHYDLNV